jgi:hypothetical protein
MTRDEFTAGFVQRFRNVIQKQERARGVRNPADLNLISHVARQRYDQAQANLEATLTEFADYVYDALEKPELAVSGQGRERR